MADLPDIDLRPFRDEDRPAIVAFQNARRPPHLQETVAEWERGDPRRPPDEVRLQLCVGDPPVAYLSAVDRGTSVYRKEGVCSFGLWVNEGYQQQGLGDALYARAVQFAGERGLRQMATYVRLFRPDEPAVPFLTKRGFAEMDREVPVILDLAMFDPVRFVSPASEGIIFRDIPIHDVPPRAPRGQRADACHQPQTGVRPRRPRRQLSQGFVEKAS